MSEGAGALQALHISNQNVIYRLDPTARARLNAVYMTSYFVGAATGSAMGSVAWLWGGWGATCALGLGLADRKSTRLNSSH